MKAPKNFRERINELEGSSWRGTRMNFSCTYPNEIGIQRIWINPLPNKRNALCVSIDWERMCYDVNVALDGDGDNFHTGLGTFPLNKIYLKSLNDFTYYILGLEVIDNHIKYFNF